MAWDGGSSPLTRGKLCEVEDTDAPARLIPAHAGKTLSGLGGHGLSPAHPRSRGENRLCDTCESFASGSSPLTRGKPLFNELRPGQVGLIPAHAGKTLFWRLVSPRHPAHPRSRGENRPGTSSGRPSIGSSPLTRGKRAVATTDEARNRLIPAHAGKTHGLPPQMMSTGAHPRSRGENLIGAPVVLRGGGSSPLTRGKRGLLPRREARSRLIPAHAGKTR